VVLLRPDLIERFSGTEVNGSPPTNGIQRSEAVVTPVDATFDLGTLVEMDSARAPAGAPAGASAESVRAARPPETTAPAPVPPATQPPPEPAARPEPEPVVRMGYLSVNAEPGAEIYIDGVYRGDAPPALRLKLVAGNHTLECRRPGHESYSESLRIVTGELSRRSVTLRKFKGMLSVTTQEGAQIYVDGKLIGVTPLRRPLDIDAGDHMVTIKKPGFNTWSSQVTVRPKETFPLHITLSPRY
jgi:serine/threonine-protein kinase